MWMALYMHELPKGVHIRDCGGGERFLETLARREIRRMGMDVTEDSVNDWVQFMQEYLSWYRPWSAIRSTRRLRDFHRHSLG